MLALAGDAVGAAHWAEQDYSRIFSADAVSRRIALVIEASGIIGFIVAGAVGNEWEIENMAVAAGFRRRGVGLRLVTALLDLARRKGAESVYLEVRESNTAARGLYRRCGFCEVGSRRDYYRDPPEKAILCRFTLPFSKTVEGP